MEKSLPLLPSLHWQPCAARRMCALHLYYCALHLYYWRYFYLLPALAAAVGCAAKAGRK
jgi:hypothetical protein